MYSNLPERDELLGETVLEKWKLTEQVGHGNIGVVYKAEQDIEGGGRLDAACKLIPEDNLVDGWEEEIKKGARLDEHDNIVSLKDWGEDEIKGEFYVCIVSEFVRGPELLDYIQNNESEITLEVVETITHEILDALHAMDVVGIEHGDLHPRNVLLSLSPLSLDDQPTVKITDFGIGGSVNNKEPKDDYVQLADIVRHMLESVERKQLDSSDRYFYNYLLDEFVSKYVLESDPTKGDYVRNPGELSDLLRDGRSISRDKLESKRDISLENPFDYLSCEQMGDSYELIERLYSDNFPGYGRVQSRGNTILTGPRGCGKTTILRNMSLRTKVEAETLESIDDLEYLGVYYPSQDLHFTFHYLTDDPDERDRDILVHYLSLSLTKEFLQSIALIRDRFDVDVPEFAIESFEDALVEWIDNYQVPPKQTDKLEHLISVLNQEKSRVGTALRHHDKERDEIESTIPRDFLGNSTKELINKAKWGSGLPIFFLIDDYSLPKITEAMQSTLNDVIMARMDQVYFKISTESITAFHALDASGKSLEESREFEVVDLANHFIGASEKRQEFLTEVINTRLINTEGLPEKYTDLVTILGEGPYDTYVELAKEIRSSRSVTYAGYDTMCNIFSGDLSEILRMIRGMFEEAGSEEEWRNGSVSLPIDQDLQDRVIREYGASFLNKIGSVPDTGSALKNIAQSFGDHCNHLLLTQTSSNQKGDPPKQAFRIEVRDSFSFEQGDVFAEVAAKVRKSTSESRSQDELVEEAEAIYNDLLRYGVFLLDIRGKSIRGKVVQRLYLRRLLLPKFNLTPSQRDNVSMEPSDFLHLLIDPEGFPLPDAERPMDQDLSNFNNIDTDGEPNLEN